MISNRQQRLFAGEDWTVAYKAFTQVDFQAYDYDSMRDALINYIRVNYPENFNDFIESSEFIAIIEMLAYLSSLLVFRMDLNTRENFLETAERRESVYQLARMLGYSPSRNRAAEGLLKLVSVRTTEPLRDSSGSLLDGERIFWDDANNPDAYEQFITILNSAMANTNRFTSPVKAEVVEGIRTELYQLNTPTNAPIAYGFDLDVNGVNRDFELVNVDFDNSGSFTERHPNPVNAMHFVYRNDGLGRQSPSNGFFFYFKQGRLRSSDFNYTVPQESRVEPIAVSNINETDFWLQETNRDGTVLNKWHRVPNTVGQTLSYNSLNLGTRNLYALETVDNNQVRIKFPDGNFGEVPYGLYRAWYRVSDDQQFSLQPDDARSVNLRIPYINQRGEPHTLFVNLRLETEVNNSQPAETITDIKQRAPEVYYTQNRMVSAQDYNTLPTSFSSNIRKLKAINRTYAGHSRYIELRDPTGSFQDIEAYGEDGAIYRSLVETASSVEISPGNTVRTVVRDVLPALLRGVEINNFVYDAMRKAWTEFQSTKFDQRVNNVIWKPLPVTLEASETGFFQESGSTGQPAVLVNTDPRYRVFRESNLLRMVDPAAPTNSKWTRITRADNSGALFSGSSAQTGPFSLSSPVLPGWRADEVIVSLRKVFNQAESDQIQQKMLDRKSFGLGYNLTADQWYIIPAERVSRDAAWNPATLGSSNDTTWLVLMDFQPVNADTYRYQVTMRGQRYVFQSLGDVRFYNIKNVKSVNSTGVAQRDTVSFTTLNTQPGRIERLMWDDTSGNGVGDRWLSLDTGEFYAPNGLLTNIPLRNRDVKWTDVELSWRSNFGLLREGDIDQNLFVDETTLPINVYFDDGNLNTSNATIANATGQLTRLPGKLVVPFNNTTFGANIVDSNGDIAYHQFNNVDSANEIFQGNAAPVSTVNPAVPGRIRLLNYDTATETGNLEVGNIDSNFYLYARDSQRLAVDELQINYLVDVERLKEPITWQIVDTVRYPDGYVDPTKVVVAPVDTDGDLVPDRPLQFDEFVGSKDLLLYELVKDFDGYEYEQPVRAAVLDLRRETTVTVLGGEISPGSKNSPVKISDLDWILLANRSILDDHIENTQGRFGGLLVYVESEDIVYKMVPASTNINIVKAVPTNNFSVKVGRGFEQNTLSPRKTPAVFRWQHIAPSDVRIDPSISNVVEMQIITNTYYTAIQRYLNVPGTPLPQPPTSGQLSREFRALNDFKNAADTIVFQSGRARLLFGADAEVDLQAQFQVVRLPGSTLSDNEIRSRVVKAIREYFDIDNWQFGETFYFTELSSYIHQQLGNVVGSIVILPRVPQGRFGDLFEIRPEPNEIFVATVKPTDINIVSKITNNAAKSSS
jgi:hypothetical protein